MVPVAGSLVEDCEVHYEYSLDCLDDLAVYNSPNCDEDHLTSVSYRPGSIIIGCAVWTTTVGAISAEVLEGGDGEEGEAAGASAGAGGSGDAGSEEKLIFVKLADGRGWVPVYHPVTGGLMLNLLSNTKVRLA
jgi:hypothetical protein